MAGDPALPMLERLAQRVSIRARHRWRAIHANATAYRRQPPCFNPRPPSMAGDPTPAAPRLANVGFQSAPAIDGGRSRIPTRPAPARSRFNPRPPSMAGDPCVCNPWGFPMQVSIRARHRWRAIPAGRRSAASAGRRFNPRPPSMAGDPQPWRKTHPVSLCFNPRPPSMAGDPVFRRTSKLTRAVSIRARHRWRAILSAAFSASHS